MANQRTLRMRQKMRTAGAEYVGVQPDSLAFMRHASKPAPKPRPKKADLQVRAEDALDHFLANGGVVTKCPPAKAP